ncbi:putative pterin-binding protein [Alsobacter sp. R-9]
MRRLLVLALALLTGMAAPTASKALDRPSGQVLLTVSGAITNTNDGDRAVFDRAMLERLGLARLRTTTPWTDGVVEFEGVPVKALLDAVGIKGRRLKAMAINDYSVELDATEFDRIPALLAMRMNGVQLRVRDKGPIWIVYPYEELPSFREEANNHKWIWQLKSIVVQ